MSIYTVDDDGQVFISPSELDDFEYYRDNIFVRTYEEFLTLNPHEIFVYDGIVIYDSATSDPGTGLDAALDQNEALCVIFGLITGLQFATNATGSWIVTEIHSSGWAGPFFDIVKDSSHYFHLCVGINTTGTYEVSYFTNTTGSWVRTVVETVYDFSVGIDSQLIFDSSGYIHLFYHIKTTSTNYSLKHATNATGSWQVESLQDETSLFFSINAQLKGNGDFVIAVSHGSESEIKILTGTWGSWTETSSGSETISWLGIGHVIDSSDKSHILYGTKTFSNSKLYYLTNATGSWVETLVNSISDGHFRECALLQDPSGYLHCHYTEVPSSNTNRKQMYASNISGSWSNFLIRDPGTADGQTFTAITRKSDGQIFLISNWSPGDWTTRSIQYVKL